MNRAGQPRAASMRFRRTVTPVTGSSRPPPSNWNSAGIIRRPSPGRRRSRNGYAPAVWRPPRSSEGACWWRLVLGFRWTFRRCSRRRRLIISMPACGGRGRFCPSAQRRPSRDRQLRCGLVSARYPDDRSGINRFARGMVRHGAGFHPETPTKGLCPLDPHQGQWPLEPFILVGEWERADTDLDTSRLALSHPQPMDRLQRALPFAGGPGGKASWWVQGRSPCAWSGQAMALPDGR